MARPRRPRLFAPWSHCACTVLTSLATAWSSCSGVLKAWPGPLFRFRARPQAVPLQGSLVFNSPPAALNGTVDVNVDENNGGAPAVLDAIDEATGAIKWTQNVSGGGRMSPAVTATDVFSIKCAQLADR